MMEFIWAVDVFMMQSRGFATTTDWGDGHPAILKASELYHLRTHGQKQEMSS
jgi:hypothetical protein